MSRVLVANLDVESQWQRRLLPHRPMPRLSRPALERLSAFGTLLRAFAQEGNTLWTPAAVDRARLTSLLPLPDLVSGAWDSTSADFRWGHLGEISARVNHRRFSWNLGRSLGIALEGSAWASTETELFDALAGLDRWVVKAPLSAAGRDRVIGENLPDETARRRLLKLLARSDGLLVEPWLDRQDDFGVLIQVADEAAHVVSMHRQVIDGGGGFVGIDGQHTVSALDSALDPSGELHSTASAVGEALRREGYRGPAGVDAWTWRGPDGGTRLNPLGEINARLSFGWVARQIGTLLDRDSVRLRFGSARQLQALKRRAEVLLRPDAAGHGAAWLE